MVNITRKVNDPLYSGVNEVLDYSTVLLMQLDKSNWLQRSITD